LSLQIPMVDTMRSPLPEGRLHACGDYTSSRMPLR
jgi:hypothetical protein